MRIGLFLLIFTCFGLSPVYAQTPENQPDIQQTPDAAGNAAADTAEDSIPPAKQPVSFLSLLQASGLIGFVIILLSVAAVALIIEYVLLIRRSFFMPAGFADAALTLLSQGQAGTVLQKCRNNASPLAQILYAGISQYEFGWDAVAKAAEEIAAEQTARLYRKIEYLNVIGNIAPMLGLLGTVVGMVFAFQHISNTAGSTQASELAEGIYLALVTTVEGLLVAIPCLAAHAFFCNRIAALISETVFTAEQVLLPVKKNILLKNRQNSGTHRE
ncbi:MAG: MotA/TolQ/ExbB proton channel family protein [Planctomycetaceae bacterium]|jgi:biopolymer transport protein ExbB|nr:MotA/TolQ/ExbB proton channel family protein [Planctomycetaceae bacterium]